jgi:tRNA(Ile)-lysidine synthase
VEWAENAPRAGSWGVAFSGGADSLALLLLIWALWPERRRRLRVLHFDHRLRGAASRADAKFCREVADALGVTFYTDVWRDVPPKPSEAAARSARTAFFRTKARVVWLGHHADDVAETIFMRLARGSGTGGLAAPRPVQRLGDNRVNLRPLLTLTKSELVAATSQAGAVWREDASNQGGDFLRNRVRHQVLAAWKRASEPRDALAGLLRSRELLDEDDVALEAWLDEISPIRADGALSLRRIAGKPRGLVRRALLRWLHDGVLRNSGGKGLSRQAVKALLEDILQGRLTRHSLGAAGFAVIRRDRVSAETSGGRKLSPRFQRRAN